MRRLRLVRVVAGAFLAAACASAPDPQMTSLTAASVVPFQTLANLTLVSATVNGSPQAAVFLVDTGASQTLLSPLLAKRVGVTVPVQAARRDLRVVGGAIVSVPLVRVHSLQVGEARVDQMEVGVYDFSPEARSIDGLLGGDFLNRFKVTFDRVSGRMILEPAAAARR